ncbi:MAG: hypothetical protein HY647_03840 [Acidobacteria bacterium]|nr:hypothetical protein [Acidobacteriota bacterium]
MPRFNPVAFSQPDLLKRIQARTLLALLRMYAAFFEARQFSLPADDRLSAQHYLQLAGILAQPDESTPSDLVEALHLISNLGTDEHFDELLALARRYLIDTAGDVTAEDLAARIWLSTPQLLIQMDRTELLDRRRRFESFPATDPDDVTPIEALPSELSPLEGDLDGWFKSKKRGIGSKVIRKDSSNEVRFLIQHGQPCRREPSRRGSESTSTFFRPEKTDVVIYDLGNNELRINTSTLGELRLYRNQFGKHLFGDENKFLYAEKYTLEPLREQGEEALSCRDIQGMESVVLREIEYGRAGGYEHVIKHKAADLFAALAASEEGIEREAKLLMAKFSVALEGQKLPCSVVIRPRNIAEYGRGEQALQIEQWLRARGFVHVGSAAYAETEPVMASA